MGRTAGLPSIAINSVDDASDGENSRLRRSNDGAELIDVIHAEITDGECRVRDVGRTQLPGPRALGNGAALAGDLREVRNVSVGDYSCDYAVVHRNGHTHIHVIVESNALRSPA